MVIPPYYIQEEDIVHWEKSWNEIFLAKLAYLSLENDASKQFEGK